MLFETTTGFCFGLRGVLGRAVAAQLRPWWGGTGAIRAAGLGQRILTVMGARWVKNRGHRLLRCRFDRLLRANYGLVLHGSHSLDLPFALWNPLSNGWSKYGVAKEVRQGL